MTQIIRHLFIITFIKSTESEIISESNINEKYGASAIHAAFQVPFVHGHFLSANTRLRNKHFHMWDNLKLNYSMEKYITGTYSTC